MKADGPDDRTPGTAGANGGAPARTHAPSGYDCPFCRFARGVETPSNALTDIVYDDGEVFAFVAPRTWPANAGNALVVPKAHYEHLYALPDDLTARVAIVAKRVAVAMLDAYGSAGTSTRQHNEPAGGQDVFHYHLHVFPRWHGDHLYERHAEARFVPVEERCGYAERLRAAIEGGRRRPVGSLAGRLQGATCAGAEPTHVPAANASEAYGRRRPVG